MQLPFKVNAHVMVQPCAHCIWFCETTGVRLERPVGGAVSTLICLDANANWDHNLRRESTNTLILVTLPTYTLPFSYN